MKKKCILLLVLLFPLLTLAQENFILTKFSNFKSTVIQEKLLISTDRPHYVAQEIIWFKIYIVDASFHKSLDISKVTYVELLDENNQPMLQAKVALKNGIGSGSFQIPNEIQSGTYHLRAYTNWMKNFSSSLFYDKELTIVGTDAIAVEKISEQKTDYDIQFFPEGGALVDGIKSKIAYKIINQNGIGEDLNGVVVNAKNETLTKLVNSKYGMGSFAIEAKVNERLVAVFKNLKGEVFKKELPKINNSGIVMNLNRDTKGLITVNVYAKNYPSTAVTLFAHTRNQVCINETKAFTNGIASFVFNEQDLKDGISQLTIFDDSNKPVCERLYFKKPVDVLSITATLGNKTYAKRSEIAVNLNAKDNANVSISIYKADELNLGRNENLSTLLWLSSELKGKVEHPEYYLDHGIENSLDADNLMLTQGWRRFKWNDVLGSKLFEPNYVPEYRGLTINTLLNTTSNIKTFLTVLEATPKTFFSPIKGNGKSSFLTNFYGKKTLIFQTDPQDDSVSKFTLINPFLIHNQIYKSNSNQIANVSNFSSRYIAAQVQAKYYEQQYQPISEGTLNIGTTPTIVYNIDDYVKFPTIQETIKEYVRGVSTYKKNDKEYIKISYRNDLNTLDYMPEKALVLFDGIPDFNYGDILTYKTVNIDQISVLQEKYFDNDISMGGVFQIKSKDKNLSHFKSPNALIIDFEGLQQQRIFYSPKYITGEQKSSRIPDFRNLLYWNASTYLNKDANLKINFFTSDQTGRYLGLIEGLSDNGKAGNQVISFEVK